MSAIEMMDPKMDAGMMCNRGSKKVLNFDQALKVNWHKHYKTKALKLQYNRWKNIYLALNIFSLNFIEILCNGIRKNGYLNYDKFQV